MSDNLIERLRDWTTVWPQDEEKPDGSLYFEAADRIEELEAKLAKLEKGGQTMTHDVNRWHSSPHSKLRNSGDTIYRHQWRVAELLGWLWPEAPQAAIAYAVSHDAHEAQMGDIPSPEKQQWSAELRRLYEAREAEVQAQMGLPSCPPEWAAQVAFCDRLDAYRWAAKHCPEALDSDGFPELREDLLRQAKGFGLGEVGL